MIVRFLAPLGAALTLSACVVAPPPVVAVPGYNKDQTAFAADETACREEGSRAAYDDPAKSSGAASAPGIGTRSGNAAAWQRYDDQYAQCMSARGDSLEVPPTGYGYGYPYGGYGYPYAYGYPYSVGVAYPFGGFYGGIYDGFGLGYGGFGYGGFGFGYGGFGYGRFGYGGYGRFGGYGYGHGGFGGGFGHGGGFGGGFGGHGGGGGHR